MLMCKIKLVEAGKVRHLVAGGHPGLKLPPLPAGWLNVVYSSFLVAEDMKRPISTKCAPSFGPPNLEVVH